MYSFIAFGWLILILRFFYCAYKFLSSTQDYYKKISQFQIDIIISEGFAVLMLLMTLYVHEPPFGGS